MNKLLSIVEDTNGYFIQTDVTSLDELTIAMKITGCSSVIPFESFSRIPMLADNGVLYMILNYDLDNNKAQYEITKTYVGNSGTNSITSIICN